MSYPLLTAAAVTGLLIVLLWVRLRGLYRSESSPEREKFTEFYRRNINRLLEKGFSSAALLGLVHYLCLHLFPPLIGFGFLLRTDANFLVVMASIFWSLKLVKLYPGLDEPGK